jgi:DNA-directed RNA polymerase subunit K/omega
MNAPIMINDLQGETDPLKIAFMEYRQNKLPFKIVRTFPNGKMKEFKLSEMKNIHDFDHV